MHNDINQMAEAFVSNDPELSAMLRAVDALGDAFRVINPAVGDQERELFAHCVHLVALRVAEYATKRLNDEIVSSLN